MATIASPIRPALAVLAVSLACGGQRPASVDRSRRDPEGPPIYEGRAIADPCTNGAWLDRPGRAERQQPDRVLDALAIPLGATVADVGAGTGFYTLRLARRVGLMGKVLATELQPAMLRAIDAKLHDARIDNVQLVGATERDARLPARCCDLVLLADVYHELADPPAVMAGIRRALKDRARLVLVEHRAEDPRNASRGPHAITLAKLRAELEPMGFAFVESLEFLPEQRIVIFVRDDAPPPTPAGRSR